MNLTALLIGVVAAVLSLFSSPTIAQTLKPVQNFTDTHVRETPKSSAVTNPKRAYPPSCLTLPLPTTPIGPGLTGTLPLRDVITGLLRPVTLTFWRLPCSSTKGALLLTMQTDPFSGISLPLFAGAQDGQLIYFRLNTEPNTLIQGQNDVNFLSSGVKTLIVDIGEGTEFTPDLNRPFSISAAYPDGFIALPQISVSAYSANSYPPLGDLPLSGYLTGGYYEPTRSGEGMLIEIAEVGETLLAVVSWYTFDANGFPFWLVGAAPFQPGDTSATISLISKSGGRIAGDFNPDAVPDLPWGNITISFPSCNAMRFSYQSTHSIQGLPVGSGERVWSRITSVNRFACE